MPKSNFFRFKEGVQLSGVSLNIHQKGQVLYVCNASTVAKRGIAGSSDNDGLTPEHPLATIDDANNKSTANRGDVVIILPGHAETISDAASIVLDTAGVRFIGVGQGNQKPTITLDNASSNIPISAAGIRIEGIRLVASAASVTAAMTVTAAGVELDLETRDTDSTHAMVTALLTTAACSNLKAKLEHKGFAASTVGVRYVDLVGVVDAELEIDYFGKSSTSVVDMRTTACADVRVSGRFYNDSVALTKNVTDNATSTWSVRGHDAKGGYDFVGSDDSAVAAISSAGPSTSLGTDGTTVTDSATTVLGAIGANNADNAFASTSVVSNKDGSVLERLEDLTDQGVRTLVSAIKAVPQTATTPGTTIFTVTGGPIQIIDLCAEVTTTIANTATAVTYSTTDTVASTTQTISAASASIATIAAGRVIRLDPVSLSTAPVITAAGGSALFNAAAGNAALGGIFMMPGTCNMITDASPATGNIKHRLTYRPLAPGVVVTMS